MGTTSEAFVQLRSMSKNSHEQHKASDRSDCGFMTQFMCYGTDVGMALCHNLDISTVR